jgi:chorismate mutase/prephenate dehydratase
MTWIESFPIPGPLVKGDDSNPSYLFFIDVEGHVNDASVQQALDVIRKRCERLDIIGSYPRSACIES